MSGIDQWLTADVSGAASLPLLVAAALLLGVRHATDPDHLVAVGNLIATRRDGARRSAAALGLAWGAGHGLVLLAVGLPIVLAQVYLPGPVQQAAEAAVGLLIAALAVRLLVRWRRGGLAHDTHPLRARSPLAAFGIGVLHGLGGSAAVTVMLLTMVADPLTASVGLALFASGAALSMAALSGGLGAALASGTVQRSLGVLAPVLGTASLGFGVWYAISASTGALGGV